LPHGVHHAYSVSLGDEARHGFASNPQRQYGAELTLTHLM
jgi:hypothetical protein